jgi:hypothetical protein
MMCHGTMLKVLILQLKIIFKSDFLFPKGNMKIRRHIYTYNVHSVHAYVCAHVHVYVGEVGGGDISVCQHWMSKCDMIYIFQ